MEKISYKFKYLLPFMLLSMALCLFSCSGSTSSCEHNFTVNNEVEATCTSDGYVEYKCSKCGENKSETTSKLGHDYVKESEYKASCTNDGYITYLCSQCDDSYTEKTDKAIGHNYRKILDTTATCSERGIAVFLCSNCQDSYTEYKDKLQHNYNLEETISATCTEEGKSIYSCSLCSDKKTEFLPKLSHNYVEIGNRAPSCTVEGIVYYECSFCHTGKTDTIPPLNHDYSDLEIVREVSCVQTGLNRYNCIREGCTESITEEIPKIPHNPNGNATIHKDCICTMCSIVLQPKLDHELSINYNYGYAYDYHTTPINSQDRTGYDLGYHNYYSTPMPFPGSGITFNERMSLQDFYTHNLLTAKKVTTKDGKRFYVDGGFKVAFEFQTLSTQLYDNGGMNIIKFSDFEDQFESDSILKIVKESKSSDKFYKIYEVIDFADSYLEISKLIDGKYVAVATVNTAKDWNSILGSNKVVLSDKDGKMFMEAGDYRVMFKLSVSWFIESSNGEIYDANGKQCYPYGIINDQYDYFYVTVTDDTYNTLLPDDLDESKDMFYQISMDDINNGAPFIKSGSTVDVADDIDLIFDSKIGYWDNLLRYNGEILTMWSMDFSLYDEKTDAYIKKSSYNLLDYLTTSGTGKIKMSKSFQTGYCKITVSYTFENVDTEEKTTYTDVYYLYIS